LTTRPIVLVDDNGDALRLADFVFQEAGLRARHVLLQSGSELLTYLERALADGEGLPCCILLDISMPDMNGIDVLSLVRQRECFKELRIIMLTNSNDSDDRERALAAGADGYQVKPFGLTEFIEFIRQLEGDFRAEA